MHDLHFNSGAVKPVECVSEGWDLIKSDFGVIFALCVGAFLLEILIGFVPYVGGVINAAVAGPLSCGIYFALIQKRRGEPVDFGMLFRRFDRFVPASLVTLISMFPWLGLGLAATLFTDGVPELDPNASPEQLSAVIAAFGSTILGYYLAAAVVSFVLWIFMFCALPMIAERDIEFGRAFGLSLRAGMANLGGLFLLGILQGLMMFAGFFALCVGFLLVLPLIYAANFVAYKKIFPDSRQEEFDGPPEPEYYQSTFGS